MRANMQLVPADRDRDHMLDYPDHEMGDPTAGQPHASILHRAHLLLRGRYKWAVLLGIVAGAGGGVVGWRSGQKLYSSTGWVHVTPTIPAVQFRTDENGILPMFDQYMETQAALIKNQRVIDMAIENEEWQKVGRGNSAEASAEFTRNLSVTRKAEMIGITYVDGDDRVVKKAVAAVVDAYNKLYIEGDLAQGTKRLEYLGERARVLHNELVIKRQKIMSIAALYADGDLEGKFKHETEELNKLDAQVNEMEMKLTAAGSTELPTTTQPAQQPDFKNLADEDIALMYAPMSDKMKERTAIEEQMSLMQASGKGMNHPAMIDLNARLNVVKASEAKIREAFLKRVNRQGPMAMVQGAVGAESIATLKLKRDAASERLEKKRLVVKELALHKVEVEQLKGEEELKRAELESVNQRIEQLTVESKMSGRVSVVSDGERPIVAKDDRTALAGGGAAGGVGVGFAVVLLAALMDRRFRSPEDARAAMRSSPMLGILPNLPDDLADPEQAALTAHFVHQIRTLLQIWEGSNEQRAFSITSPVSGTGKTSLTLALGVSFAAADSKTLLIDCDIIGGGLTGRANAIVRRKIGKILQKEGLITGKQLEEALKLASGRQARLGEILIELGYVTEGDLNTALVSQQKAAVGLLDVIAGESLDDCVAETGIPNLSVLPLGSAKAQHASKLSPLAMRRVIQECRKRFDTILIDTGPVPGSLEASVVAAQVDGVILCVSRGEQRPLAEKSVDHLLSIGAKVAGVVFNRARHEDMTIYSTTLRTSLPQDNGKAGGERAQSSRFGPMARAVASSGPGAPGGANGNGEEIKKAS
jgi:succinoglycan biosynthesis transport protein ExoP